MMSFKRKHQDATPLTPPALQIQYEDPNESHFAVGSIYQIDHAQLPIRSPIQLRSIRVVIVGEKTEKNISVNYPSLESLTKHFMKSNIRGSETFPALEEKFTMGIKLAGKLLYREVSSQEFADNMAFKSFWLVSNGDTPISKNSLSSVLKCSGMLTWGVRRRVKFLGKHTESSENSMSNRRKVPLLAGQKQEAASDGEADYQEDDTDAIEEEHGVKAKEEEELDDNADNDDDNCEDDNDDDDQETKTTLKRKRYSLRHKKKKSQYRKKVIKSENKCRQIVLSNQIHRWSTQRYKAAEKSLLEVMKAKEAVFGKPILRPELRAEARKNIGDTGLLDHLLKHMAGKVAPGETDRFRRRHNADGAMEYWLESADLVNIRREAGVEDPYWTPPPGWKPGDCPTQDPMCVKELNSLKAEISSIRRDMEDMVPRKQFEEEMEKCRKNLSTLTDTTRAMQEEMEKLRREVSGKIGSEIIVAGEGRAEMIKRLKSGFKMCKPQGSFLWPPPPNHSSSSNTTSLELVPTPPSVSSSPARNYSKQPESPVIRPLAQRHPLTVAVYTVPGSAGGGSVIDLNHVPAGGEGGVAANSPSSLSCLSNNGEAMWLALATPTPPPPPPSSELYYKRRRC